ncbi:hypothetical protein EGW08_009632 [Elysia chlorotica]|uniref:Transmembrane protein 267 n=1 Tax=Elysia chlorotica TaxID=188477 RepID=A0A3S1B8W5_ELYCH|nr:hypothetical protein EGW08_009632 [Elysia chlorotica]
MSSIFETCFPSPILTLFLCLMIVTVCLTGDGMLKKADLVSSNGKYSVSMLKAFVDSSTHALVGFLVWAMVENACLLVKYNKWLNCMVAAILAGIVDLDHFMAAGSFKLERALHLERRPPFHNTSLVLLGTLICLLLSKWRSEMWVFALMFFSSWLSHHLRDANHRGLWFAPFGHTPLFSTQLYIFSILVLSVCVRIIAVFQRSPTASSPSSSENFVKVV